MRLTCVFATNFSTISLCLTEETLLVCHMHQSHTAKSAKKFLIVYCLYTWQVDRTYLWVRVGHVGGNSLQDKLYIAPLPLPKQNAIIAL